MWLKIASLKELRAAFRDRLELIFRHFDDCTVPFLRWQCGRSRPIEVQRDDGFWEFELIAHSATASGLIDKLAQDPILNSG